MRIAGIDEAGRGPLAGPVVAAAVVFPEGYSNPAINDSKKLTAKKREALFSTIIDDALDYAIVAVGPRRIESLNIREATRTAMSLALARVQADFARIDGNTPIVTDVPQETVVKGDSKFVDIAAASILAKVHRDNIMGELNERYPGFDLNKHSGYPTKAHKAALQELGPSPIHRLTFRGVRETIRTRNHALVKAHAKRLQLPVYP